LFYPIGSDVAPDFFVEMLKNDSQNAFCESKVLNCESMYRFFFYICNIITRF